MAFSLSLDKELFLDTDKTDKIRLFREIRVQLLLNSDFEKAMGIKVVATLLHFPSLYNPNDAG